MRFNPTLHTQAYLLEHPAVAVELAKTSATFIKTLAQDEAFLIDIQQVTHELDFSEQPLRALCGNKAWVCSGAAQNKNVLKLVFTTGLAVAHLLSKNVEWACSPAAQDIDVLRITRPNGFSVGHSLARIKEWGLSPAAQDMNIINGLRNRHVGEAVVHYLAKLNESWFSTPAANTRDVLWLTTTRDSISVFEHAFVFNTDKDLSVSARAEILLRPLKFGDAVFLNDPDKLTVKMVKLFVKGAMDYIDGAIDESVRAQLVSALYSSLVNLKTTYGKSKIDQLVEKELVSSALEVESLLLGLVADNADLSGLLSGRGKHCGPARELVLKRKNEAIFEGVSESFEAREAEISTKEPLPTLY